MEEFDFSKRLTKKRMGDFANLMKSISRTIGMKVSSRGWCYIMEGRGVINKDQFDRVTDAINRCRKDGFLPVDFVAEESARQFHGVEEPSELNGLTLKRCLEWSLEGAMDGHRYYTPNWWKNEEYYIQIVVEKVDLVNLFKPITDRFHIPIANSKGWSSISQRAEYSRRFKEAQDMGLKCVLLYCGDHDPDGLRISETLMSNLRDVKDIVWNDGETGYDPRDLIIDRFGLNYEYIIDNGFTWIDNLITGNTAKKMDLSEERHPNHFLPYVQHYLGVVGARKCEANVLVVTPERARELVLEAILKYVGPDAEDRFKVKREEIEERYSRMLDQFGVREDIQAIINKVDDQYENDSDDDTE
jgi:hypothetical protein